MAQSNPAGSAAASTADALDRTPLYDLHMELGGRMVEFAGYAMPVQYPAGIMAEHLHTRADASLFDVSHMGQVTLADGRGGRDAAAALETLVPGDIAGLGLGCMRYTQFTNEGGGILDDLMVTNAERHLLVVVNAACKAQDIALLEDGLRSVCAIEPQRERALLALQGPKAAEVLARHAPGSRNLVFLTGAELPVGGIDCFVSRSGYTGEDGFEISVSAARAETLARLLLGEAEVEPAGLGARDSLRLEAGLCLYGHDIDATTTPVEAALTWSIGKRRREEGGFPGDAVIRRQIAQGVTRKRVGILSDGRAPAREGTDIVDPSGAPAGKITSGGFGPTVGAPVAMGYVRSDLAKEGTALDLMVRGKARSATVAKLPFVKPGYYRG